MHRIISVQFKFELWSDFGVLVLVQNMSVPTSSMSHQAVQLALEDLTDKIEVIDARSETKLVVFWEYYFQIKR